MIAVILKYSNLSCLSQKQSVMRDIMSNLTNRRNITRYFFADLVLDVQRGTLTRNNKEIPLPKLSYDLLLALLRASPTLLSQQELMEIVWPNVVIGDETLKQRVKLLRKAITDNASAPTYIEAVRGRGYRLLPEVTCECTLAQPAAAMLDLTGNDQFPNLGSQQFHGAWQALSKILFTLLLLISLLVVIYGYFFQNPILSAITHAITDKTVSIDASDINEGKPNTEQVAQELYQKGLLYYQRYRAVDNIIAIDFFKKSIAIKADYSLAYTGLSQAYSQQIFQFKSDNSTQAHAIDNAYQAITYDSNSAESYKALGTAYYVSGWLSKSIAPYLKSLALDPNNTEVVSNLSFIYSEQGNLIDALTLIEKALSLDNKHVVSMVHAGQTLQRLGQFELAKIWYKKAIALQPDYLLATYHLGQLAIVNEEYAVAEKIYQEKLNLYNEHPLLIEGLADSFYFSKRAELALEFYQKLQFDDQTAIDDKQMVSSANLMRLMLSLPESKKQVRQVERVLKDKLQSGTDKALYSYNLAIIYAQTEQSNLAIRYLVQAIEQGITSVEKVNKHTMFEPLYELPSFKKLIINMKAKQSSFNAQIKMNLSFWQKK